MNKFFNNLFKPQMLAGSAVRQWFAFVQDATAKSANISIDDEIGGWGISARNLVNNIKGLSKDTTISVHIFSPGGDVLEANEIYNALSEHEGRVEIEIGALCASAATIIACAGDTISMADNGLFMIHNPWTIGYGDAAEFRKTADILDKFKGNIVGAYSKRTGLKDEALGKLMDEETWMTAEEAKAKNFIDSIKETPEDAESIEDSFDLSRFKNSAAALSRLPKKREAQKPPEASGDTQPAGKPKTTSNINKDDQLLTMYQKGSIRIFASVAALALSGVPALSRFGEKDGPKIQNNGAGGGTEAPPSEDEQKFNARVAEAAKKLLMAKNKRDEEIDAVVLNVRKRDGKDFSELAGEYKREDKTVADFCLAITSSDKFKPFKAEEIGSGVEVLGVVGLDKGTPGELFVSSEEYRALVTAFGKGKGSKSQHNLAIATNGFIAAAMARFLNATSSSGLTSIEKLPGVVTLGVRPLMVKDLIAPGATNNTTIRYIQENSFTNGADTVAEGATKPAATFDLTEIDATVKKIAAYTKVTDELFMDYLAVASYINMRLPYMVERTEEDQLLNGDGTGNNLKGILSFAGIQTQAKGGDSAIDAIYKSITKVRWGNLGGTAQGGFEPDGIIIHPTDWEAIRLLKDGNQQYYGGGPFTGAYGNGGGNFTFEMLWGKPCVVTPAIAQGTALTGAFRLASQYFQRQGLTIQSTNTDQDDFIKNLTTIRAEVRLALAVYRPLAFCQVTGL